jgi:CRP/FNR family transcriptional regulator, cyclic AMP receptor protein
MRRRTSHNAFWRDLTGPEQDELRSIGTVRGYEIGGQLFQQGARSDHVLIILDGWVKITALRADGHEVLLAIRGPADTLGESGWLNQRPRSASGVALTSVRVLIIGADRFGTFIDANTHAAQVLARAMTARMEEADRRMASQISAQGPARLAALLVDLADEFGTATGPDDAITVPLPLTQWELAQMIGNTRETVARSLTAWRRSGIITTGRMRIDVLDLPALRRAAGQQG